MAVFFFLCRSKEPSFRGKTVSFWLSSYHQAPRADADQAIQQIGTNAFPIMFSILSRGDSFDGARVSVSRFVRKRFHYDAHDVSCVDVALGFRALGPLAAAATTDLVRIYDEPSSSKATILAILCSMEPINKATVPLLLREARSTNWAVRNNSLAALGRVKDPPMAVVPIYLQALADTNSQVVANALYGLVQANATSAVPSIITLIRDGKNRQAAI